MKKNLENFKWKQRTKLKRLIKKKSLKLVGTEEGNWKVTSVFNYLAPEGSLIY